MDEDDYVEGLNGRFGMGAIAGLKSWLVRLTIRGDRGASLVEYALLLALIAVVCIVAVSTLGGGLSDSYDQTTDSIFN